MAKNIKERIEKLHEKRLFDVLTSTTSIPLATIERRYNELKEKYDAVENAHDAYLEAIVAEGRDVGEEESWLNDITKRFDEIEISGLFLKRSGIKYRYNDKILGRYSCSEKYNRFYS